MDNTIAVIPIEESLDGIVIPYCYYDGEQSLCDLRWNNQNPDQQKT